MSECKYCHEPYEHILDSYECGLKIDKEPSHYYAHVSAAVGFNNAEDDVLINYCPMCGRRLNDSYSAKPSIPK